MPENPGDTWVSLINQKRQLVLGSSEASLSIADEHQFRSEFETLCEQYDEKKPQLRLNSVEKLFKYIKTFVKAIDTSNCYPEATATLTIVFREAAFLSIQTALQHHITLTELISQIQKLGRIIPLFGAGLGRYPADPEVQLPLQRIFSTYIDCIHEMTKHFATAVPPLSFEPIHSSFDQGAAIISAAKKQWDDAFKAAVSREEEDYRLTSSLQSMSNGLSGKSLPPVLNAHFEVQGILGEGSSGLVQRVYDRKTEQIFARKLLHVPPNSRHGMERSKKIMVEVTIMQKLRHHHIAPCHLFIKDGEYFSIVMSPVADYDLKRFLEVECTQKGFDRSQIIKMDHWFGCLISALSYAHNQDIKHNDIKLSNILIKDYQPYLADFGSATDFSVLKNSTTPGAAILGTFIYYAPEVTEADSGGRKADVFALGCVFSEMLTVRCGRSLLDYLNYRNPSRALKEYPYNANLFKVKRWLSELEDNIARDDDHLKDVVEQTRRMIEADKERRTDATAVKRKLRAQDVELFCPSCE